MNEMFNVEKLIHKGMENDIDPKKMIDSLLKARKFNLSDFEIYKELYKEIYGRTLCKEFCSEMVNCMHHNGEHGRKWTVEQTNELAKRNGIEFNSDYTEYEFNVVVHSMYYDYKNDLKDSGISSENILAKMADSYLTDEDAPDGKLVNYFFFVFDENL